MTRDEIISMAQTAGFSPPASADGYMGIAYDYNLQRFAAAIYAAGQAAEREARIEAQRTLQQVQEQMQRAGVAATKEAYRRGVENERDACAKVCEAFAAWMENGLHQGMSDIEDRLTNEFAKIGRDLAETIRMRGNK